MKPLWIVYNNKLLVGDMLGIIFKNGDGKRNPSPFQLYEIINYQISFCFHIFYRSKTRHVNTPDFEANG